MNTTVDTEEKVDFDTLQDDLTPEQRAYWEASIERDLQNPNRGKRMIILRQLITSVLRKTVRKSLDVKRLWKFKSPTQGLSPMPAKISKS